MPVYDAILPAPICPLGACFEQGVLTRLDFLPGIGNTVVPELPHVERLAIELDAYWKNPAHVFTLAHRASGSPFRERVWTALRGIPPGHPVSYGTLARQLGSAPRAIGQACGDNPLPIIIPCHRVVGQHGMGGFMHTQTAAPLAIKAQLLNHEHACRHE
jgi:methylated-DNA-[protein]-cysteine S-methyltransferase